MGLESFAKRLPYPIKRPLGYVYGFVPPSMRYGRVFRQTYDFLERSQWWSREQLEEHQLQQLRRLLKHAYDNVPYYRKLFDKIHFRGLARLEDIQQIPCLTKEIVRDNLDHLISVKHKRRLSYATTGGSTGVPLGFYWEKGVVNAKEHAFLWSIWNWKGIGPRDMFVVLRGAVLPGGMRTYRSAYNTLQVSSYHLTDENIPEILERIERFKPSAIQAYPSALYILARWLAGNECRLHSRLKAILTSSENLYDFQEALFLRVFDTQVFDLYGNSERTVMVNRCEKDGFHIIPQYGFVELINQEKQWCENEDEKGEIVSTAFNNYAMPFIRYKTEDIAINSTQPCPCGRHYPRLQRIEGRLQELIVTQTNRLISMTAINMHSDVFDHVRQFQFYQDKQGEVVFNVVKKDTYSAQDTKRIKRELHKKLGDDTKLEIRFVRHIPRTKSGKHRFLIQKLPVGFDN